MSHSYLEPFQTSPGALPDGPRLSAAASRERQRGRRAPAVADRRAARLAAVLLLAAVVGLLAGPARAQTDTAQTDTAQTDAAALKELAPEDAAPEDAAPATAFDTRVDADANHVPDRLGDTLTVAGRVTVSSGVLPDPDQVYLQSGGGGVALQLPEGADRVVAGDSVVATGVVDQVFGLTQVNAVRVDVIGGARRAVEPVEVTLREAHGEAYEGQLVRMRARVVNVGSNRGGRYLLVGETGEGTVLAVFVDNKRLSRFTLDRFRAGDEVEVAGILSQHDFTTPHTDYYEIVPRTNQDLTRLGLSTHYYRNAAVAVSAVFVLALFAVFLLRAEVKRRTQQLNESQERFRRLAEATYEGILIHEAGEILDINQALLDMTGFRRAEVIGRDAMEFLTPSTRRIVEPVVKGDVDPQEEPYEVVVQRRDGTSFPAEVQGKNVVQNGKTIRVAAIRDVTQRKRDEAELLLAKEQAEQVARLKSSLLNNMSHELRTPITSIIGYAELIMEEPPETHAAFAEHIYQSGRRLSETLQSVLEMAQIEAGTMDLRLEAVDVNAIAHEVANLHRQQARTKGVAVDVVGAQGCMLYTDHTLVYRILTNLVHNAVKFTDAGRVTIGVEDGRASVRLTVEDTGIGIAESFQPYLFEPFKQESQGRTRNYDGTGLGLAITKHMVGLLGGTIDVESEKNVGTRFTIDLPAFVPHGDGTDAYVDAVKGREG